MLIPSCVNYYEIVELLIQTQTQILTQTQTQILTQILTQIQVLLRKHVLVLRHLLEHEY